MSVRMLRFLITVRGSCLAFCSTLPGLVSQYSFYSFDLVAKIRAPLHISLLFFLLLLSLLLDSHDSIGSSQWSGKLELTIYSYKICGRNITKELMQP